MEHKKKEKQTKKKDNSTNGKKEYLIEKQTAKIPYQSSEVIVCYCLTKGRAGSSWLDVFPMYHLT